MIQVTRVLVKFAGVGESIPACLLVHVFPVGHDLVYARCLGSAGVVSELAFCYLCVAEVTLPSVFAARFSRKEFGARFIALVLSQDVLPHQWAGWEVSATVVTSKFRSLVHPGVGLVTALGLRMRLCGFHHSIGLVPALGLRLRV